MPPPADLSAIEQDLNRLAVEAMLAAPGRDDHLIPAYSLLAELDGRCAPEPALKAAVAALLPEFDQALDAGRPFSAELIGRLRALVGWMQPALAALRSGHPLPALPAEAGEEAPADASRPPAAEGAGAEAPLEFDLAESRELLGEFRAETADHLQQIEAALLALERNPQDPEALHAIFRSFHTIKGNSGFLGLGPMHRLAHEVESLLDLARNGRLAVGPPVVSEILRSRDAIQAMLQQVGEALETGRMPSQAVPIGPLVEAVRALGGSGPAAAPPAKAPAASAPGPAEPAPSEPAPAAPAPSRPAGHTVRVATEKLDSLMDVVGELVIVQSQLCESARKAGGADATLPRHAAQLSRLTRELQRTAMALRMVPIKPAFQKMERLARDLARETGKRIDFEAEGEETELDRIVVEELADPLVHMVRNAVDHGLEAPAERTAAGKPEAGRIRLRAYHQGGDVVVELQDDGRGIDPARVLDKARRLGLVPADAQPGREEIIGMIFLPGFSTAEKITSVSGRGVGMDVVKRNIERLRGKIEVSSEVGRGSSFRVRLPLTLAIIDGLLVRVGEDRFILPSTSVRMALRPEPGSVSRVRGSAELFDWHGRLLPLHRLRSRFGLGGGAGDPSQGIVLVVESGSRLCALLVDEMVNKQEVVIKSLGSFFQGLPGVSGGAILGDGNIALILDPGSFLEAA